MTFAQVLSDLGRRVAEERRRRGLTQAQLAEKTGVELRIIQHIEAGTRASVTRSLYDLAMGMGVTLSSLFKSPRSRPPRRPGRPRTAR